MESKLRDAKSLDALMRKSIAQSFQSAQDLRQSVHRLRAYLIDVVIGVSTPGSSIRPFGIRYKRH